MNPFEEELAWYWCQTIGTDYETNEIYRKNFLTQFSKSLKDRYPQVSKLENFDFSEVKLAYEREKEEKKNRSEEEKAKTKLEKEELGRYYGYTIVDGKFYLTQEQLKK